MQSIDGWGVCLSRLDGREKAATAPPSRQRFTLSTSPSRGEANEVVR